MGDVVSFGVAAGDDRWFPVWDAVPDRYHAVPRRVHLFTGTVKHVLHCNGFQRPARAKAGGWRGVRGRLGYLCIHLTWERGMTILVTARRRDFTGPGRWRFSPRCWLSRFESGGAEIKE